MKNLLVFLFFPFFAFANSEILIENCRGLVLVGNESEMLSRQHLCQIEGFCYRGIKIPGGASALDKKLKPLYLHQNLDKKKLDEMVREIHLYYQNHHDPLVIVTIPQQNITEGVLQIVVARSRLGKLEVEGAKWTSPSLLQRYMNLHPGEEIVFTEVIKNLSFINRNSYRQVDLIYAPGNEPRTTDITLMTTDQRPYHFYIGADDTGILSTGRERYFSGFIWQKAFGLDHIFSCQFLSSYDIHKFYAILGQYTAFLPWRHELTVYGGYSRMHAEDSKLVIQSHGQCSQASLRYTIPYKIQETWIQNFTLGFDYKRLDTTLLFNLAIVDFQQPVNLTQLVGVYNANYEGNRCKFNFEGGIYGSAGEWLPDQSTTAFQSQRTGALPYWYYFKGMASYLQKLPKDFNLSVRLRGQYTTYCVLPSEQFGIGGHDTVRGFEERQYNADKAFIANLELRTPAFPIFFHRKGRQDSFQLLAFCDYGYGFDNKLEPDQDKNESLVGTGPGLRYVFDPYLTVRFDLGFKLHPTYFPGGKAMVHFSLALSI